MFRGGRSYEKSRAFTCSLQCNNTTYAKPHWTGVGCRLTARAAAVCHGAIAALHPSRLGLLSSVARYDSLSRTLYHKRGGVPRRRRRLNFRGAVKLQNGALNANEILERRWGEAKLREGGPWAPFHVLALPRRCLFCLPAFLPLPRVDLIILPTARPWPSLLSLTLLLPPVSPFVGIVKRTTDKVFASSTFGLFSVSGEQISFVCISDFFIFHDISPPWDAFPYLSMEQPTRGITENLYAVGFLKMDGSCVSSKNHFPILEQSVWSSVGLWDGIHVNLQL